MDQELIDLRVRKAYEHYKEVRDPDIDDRALDTLNEYHSLIDNWQSDSGHLKRMGFVENFLVGAQMDAIAAKGAAAVPYENYKYIMTLPGTLRKFAELFGLRKDHLHDDDIADKIVKVQFTNYVVNNPRIEGPKPKQYTNRVLLTIFIDIMTSIANRGHLEKTAELLGIEPRGKGFPRLQILVRKVVEESLMRQDLGNELTKFTRATIAYHVPDACEKNNI